MNVIIATLALTAPCWLLLALAIVDMRYPRMIDRIGSTLFGGKRALFGEPYQDRIDRGRSR